MTVNMIFVTVTCDITSHPLPKSKKKIRKLNYKCKKKILEQLSRRARHFKSLGNSKFIVQKITELYTYLQEILRE